MSKPSGSSLCYRRSIEDLTARGRAGVGAREWVRIATCGEGAGWEGGCLETTQRRWGVDVVVGALWP